MYHGNGHNGRIPVLEDEDVKRVMEQAKHYGVRQTGKWSALMALMVNYGPRITECLMLRWADIDFERSKITFPCLKRKKSVHYTFELYPAVSQSLQTWREEQRPVAHDFAFPLGKQGRCQVWKAFQVMLKRAGVAPIKLHALRHTAITRFLEQTGDLAATQHFAKHSSLAMTSIYSHARNFKEKLLSVTPIT